jgi:zinc protease
MRRLTPMHAATALLLLLLTRDAPAAAPVGGPVPVREVEGVREYRLDNGLQVLLIPDASRATVTVNVTYRVGSRMESYGETGMAHLLEHLMFKTTTHMANFGQELSKRGMEFNGSTSEDRTNYFETFPADGGKLTWALHAEAERMTGAKVLRSDLDTEMTVVRNEMEWGENDPVNILLQKVTAAAFQWHNYGRSVIGARSDVEGVNIGHLQAFYRKYYQPDNATLLVAGAFDPAKALTQIARDFGAIPRPARKLEPTYTLEPVQDGERLVTLRRVGGQQALALAYHIPAVNSADFAAVEVLAIALGDTPNGRLHKRIVEPGKATRAFAFAERMTEPGVLYFGLTLKADDPADEAQSLLVSTVEGLSTEPVTEEEWKRARLQWEKRFDQILADPQELCLSLSEAIAAGDWRLLFALRDRIQAVTLEQVNVVARGFLKASNRTLGRFVPTAAPDRAPLERPVDAGESLKDFHASAAKEAGESFDASPANLDARTRHATLPSGLQIALLPKKNRGGTVRVRVVLHFGPEQALRGVGDSPEFSLRMIGAGTSTSTRAQIHDRLDALKTDLQAQYRLGFGAVEMTTRRGELAGALALLAEILRDPAYPASEFEQEQRRAVGDLENAATDPMSIASRQLGHRIYDYPPDDVRAVPDFAEQIRRVKALRREDLASFHRRFWSTAHAELAIVGDFDAGETQAQVERLFGDWKGSGDYVRLPLPPARVVGERIVAKTPDKANAMALGLLPLALQDTDPDYPALVLAAHVLGAGGFDSRLLIRMRQKEGASYGAGAYLQASGFEPSGSLEFYAIFAPENRERVERGFAEEVARFVAQGITADELGRAKEAIATGRRTERTDDGNVAGKWTRQMQDGRTFAFEGELEAKIQALKVEQVNAAIRRWIDPSRIDWSLAGDFK